MKNNFIVAIFMIIFIIMIMAMCSGGGESGSGRKWSDLSKTEQDNARWAYEARQAIEAQKGR